MPEKVIYLIRGRDAVSYPFFRSAVMGEAEKTAAGEGVHGVKLCISVESPPLELQSKCS